jgi:hypothetical protein
VLAFALARGACTAREYAATIGNGALEEISEALGPVIAQVLQGAGTVQPIGRGEASAAGKLNEEDVQYANEHLQFSFLASRRIAA